MAWCARTTVIFVLLYAVSGTARAANPDDVQNGRRLAFEICAACHVVGPDQTFRPTLHPPAPSFLAITRRPATNAASLHDFLTTTHGLLNVPQGMPNPQLIEDQKTAVIAYILSLRGKH